ncbi:SpoIVB peptidase [Salsuginibacillus kocurii]|uniref:SpoIVB peptidase n=1 Tax=Salsuginibacillus kocurii TaxID=427078 RepID=UPI000377D71C|nr:SpoIVB peptidase [Salsuginibacillus kocurii]
MDMRRWIGVCLLLAVAGISCLPVTQAWLDLPEKSIFFHSETAQMENTLALPDPFIKYPSKEEALKSIKANDKDSVLVTAGSTPIKKMDIKALPDIEVIPGGDSIGVRVDAEGVHIAGYHYVEQGPERISPAKEAGVKPGDILMKVGEEEVNEARDIKDVLADASAKDALPLTVKRGKEEKQVEVAPIQSEEKNQLQLGLYIQNTSAGVGTLTFYEEGSGKYGALGHVISDAAADHPAPVRGGKLLRSTVTDIEKGRNGQPGEKRATIDDRPTILGSVTKNNAFGIFGTLEGKKQTANEEEAVPIAFPEEVKEGPAELRTVIEGNKVESFDVNITSVMSQNHPATKGMVIEVTDERLIEATGGIIQGMSGSPILQDGKLVGAVTHVFVNDAKSGYASHIEWMLDEADIETYKDMREAS